MMLARLEQAQVRGHNPEPTKITASIPHMHSAKHAAAIQTHRVSAAAATAYLLNQSAVLRSH